MFWERRVLVACRQCHRCTDPVVKLARALCICVLACHVKGYPTGAVMYSEFAQKDLFQNALFQARCVAWDIGLCFQAILQKCLSGVSEQGVENQCDTVGVFSMLTGLEGVPPPGGVVAGCDEKHKASFVESLYIIILIQGLDTGTAPLLYQMLIRICSYFFFF